LIPQIFFFFAFRAAKRFLSLSAKLKIWERSNHTVASIFRQNAAKFPNKSAFLLDDKKMTFQDVSRSSCVGWVW
jgi:hypothetical protein